MQNSLYCDRCGIDERDIDRCGRQLIIYRPFRGPSGSSRNSIEHGYFEFIIILMERTAIAINDDLSFVSNRPFENIESTKKRNVKGVFLAGLTGKYEYLIY